MSITIQIVKARFFGPNAGNTQITAASDTNLAAEQDPADGADLTLTTAAGNDSLCGSGFAQQVKLVSGTGDNNSDVTYTIIGTDAFGTSQTEDHYRSSRWRKCCLNSIL